MGRILDKYYPATVCYYIWTATYADKTADTNIDGNDVYVTNTDENTFDDTIRGKLIPTSTDTDEVHHVTAERASISRSGFQRPRGDKFENPASDYRESGDLATSRGC